MNIIYSWLITLLVSAFQSTSPDQYGSIIEEMLTPSGSMNEHEYVDLGLPSGTLWASCNVGASSPLEAGGYFAWAETKGTIDGKREFSWENYVWGSTSHLNGSTLTISKYCDDISYGSVDHLLEIEAEDDAACVKWGEGWKIPSKVQIEELLNKKYTTAYVTRIADVLGTLITSKKTNKSIFLPAAGCYYGRNVSDSGNYGGYWSSTLVRGRENGAYILYFDNKAIRRTNDLTRFCGRSIRPVCNKNN